MNEQMLERKKLIEEKEELEKQIVKINIGKRKLTERKDEIDGAIRAFNVSIAKFKKEEKAKNAR